MVEITKLFAGLCTIFTWHSSNINFFLSYSRDNVWNTCSDSDQKLKHLNCQRFVEWCFLVHSYLQTWTVACLNLLQCLQWLSYNRTRTPKRFVLVISIRNSHITCKPRGGPGSTLHLPSPSKLGKNNWRKMFGKEKYNFFWIPGEKDTCNFAKFHSKQLLFISRKLMSVRSTFNWSRVQKNHISKFCKFCHKQIILKYGKRSWMWSLWVTSKVIALTKWSQ